MNLVKFWWEGNMSWVRSLCYELRLCEYLLTGYIQQAWGYLSSTWLISRGMG